MYTIWLKPRSPQNIVIGGAAGAVPVLVGWAAVTGELAAPAWVLFAIVFFWTPPHFWALSLRYRDDYAAAGIPMLPVVKGVARRARARSSSYACVVVAATLVLPLVCRRRRDLRRSRPIVLGVVFVVQAFALVAATARPSARSSFFTFSNIYLALAVRRHCRRHPRPLHLTRPRRAAVAPALALVVVADRGRRGRGHRVR